EGNPKLAPGHISKRAERVNRVADALWEDARQRREDYARFWSLYLDYTVTGITPRAFVRRPAGMRRTMRFNGVRAACDAFVAEVTDQDPRVTFATTGGTWDLRMRAKKLEQFNDGLIYQLQMHAMGRVVELDTVVTGTGVVTVLPSGEGKDARIT